MLDQYWSGSTSRISPEAPVPVVHINESHQRPGGAGNVAVNLASLNIDVELIGACGDDINGKLLTKNLQEFQVKDNLQIEKKLTTISKTRVISRHQQLIRLDHESNMLQLDKQLMVSRIDVSIKDTDLVILSDYAKGTLDGLHQIIINLSNKYKIPILIDPKGSDYSAYKGATILTPNMGEFESVVGQCCSEEMIIEKAKKLIQQLDLKALLITRSEKGMTLVEASGSVITIPANLLDVYDVTGAGDTVISVLATELLAGGSFVEAAKLANKAAGIVVGKLGAASVTEAELSGLHEIEKPVSKCLELQDLLLEVEKLQGYGQKIVMTNGCFDILQPGHIKNLQQAKSKGDVLIVALNSDESVKVLKGNDRPVNPLQHRMEVLAGLESVDFIIPFVEETPEKLICKVLPDLLVKGGGLQNF